MASYENPTNYGLVGNRSNPANRRCKNRAAILERGSWLLPEHRVSVPGEAVCACDREDRRRSEMSRRSDPPPPPPPPPAEPRPGSRCFCCALPFLECRRRSDCCVSCDFTGSLSPSARSLIRELRHRRAHLPRVTRSLVILLTATTQNQSN